MHTTSLICKRNHILRTSTLYIDISLETSTNYCNCLVYVCIYTVSMTLVQICPFSNHSNVPFVYELGHNADFGPVFGTFGFNSKTN